MTVYTVGLPHFESQEVKSSIAEKYGFSFLPLGCVVDEKMMDTVEKHNNAVFKCVRKKQGKNWEARFEAEVKEEMTLRKEIQDAAKSFVESAEMQKIESNYKINAFDHDYSLQKGPGSYTIYVLGHSPTVEAAIYITFYTLEYSVNSKEIKLLNISESLGGTKM